MAIAMAGIVAPLANAATIIENPDYSADAFSPTNLGSVNPTVDQILASVNSSAGDSVDAMQVLGTAGAPVILPFTWNGPSDPPFILNVYDNYNSGPLASSGYLNGAGNSNLSFTVPVDGNYFFLVVQNSSEGGGGIVNYTIGTNVPAPEPGAAALMTLGMGVTALRRKR